jgi:hypothetical protein
MKKKGVMIMGPSDLKAFRDLFNSEKVEVLITSIDSIVPARKGAKSEEGDVLQI